MYFVYNEPLTDLMQHRNISCNWLQGPIKLLFGQSSSLVLDKSFHFSLQVCDYVGFYEVYFYCHMLVKKAMPTV